MREVAWNASGERTPLEAAAPLPQSENRLFYPALDGLRAVAVLLVFASHYIDLPLALGWGFTGVDFFFVLSGFLITGILYDSQHRPDRYRIFYMRRALRIFPLYYAVLLLPVLLYPLFRWKLHPALWLWPVYLGNFARFLWPGDLLHNTFFFEDVPSATFPDFFYQIPHLWSLCIEEQFYLVWPFIVFSIGTRERLRNLCLAMVVVVPLLRVLVLHVFPERILSLDLLYRTMPLRGDSLLLGGAVALCLRGSEGKRLIRLAQPILLALCSLFAGFQIVSRALLGHFIDPEWVKLYSAWGYSLLALLAAAILLMAVNPGTWVYRLGLQPQLRWLGVRSYGFYVYHLLLGQVWRLASVALCLGHKGLAAKALPVVALAGTAMVSWASFKYLESPMLRLKARFA